MIDWKNWKTGAKIGFIYGLAGAIYFTPVLIAQYSPTSTIPIIMCEDPCISWYKFIGLIVFFPSVVLTALCFGPLYQNLSLNNIILTNFIIFISISTVLGAAIISCFKFLDNAHLTK